MERDEDVFVFHQVTIKYSKLGLEDFDFKHYNRTLFAGLEPHIPNAYCNCMIQVDSRSLSEQVFDKQYHRSVATLVSVLHVRYYTSWSQSDV